MIQANLNWHGDAMREQIVGTAWAGIQRATEFLFNHLRDPVLNVPNTRVKGRYTNTSKPGEPPHLRTGWLRNHVGREYDRGELQSRVGLKSNALYGVFLEFGTAKLAARPWLLATVKKLWDKLSVLVHEG